MYKERCDKLDVKDNDKEGTLYSAGVLRPQS